ncbi:MAG: nucleotide exchange factor GrpE [Patescibacteria group bacterium]
MDNENKNNQQEPAGGELEKKLADCEAKRDEYLAGWQRAKADFINYKKDEIRRLEEIAKYGSEDLMLGLVAVLNSFDLGLRAMEKQGSVEKGVYMIKSQLEDLLRQRGMERISVKPGDKFDPSVAEAIAELESDRPEGTIIEEIESGWRLHDKILRPVRVKVSKGSTPKS